jgi:hypothetical protein
MSVTGAIPTVARDFVRFADPTSGEDDCFSLENFEMAALPIVSKRANNAIPILEQRDDAPLHVHIDPLMYAVILQRSNHFQAGTIAYMRKPRIFMTAKVPLENAAIPRAVEHCAPRLELSHPRGRFLRVQFGHAPVIHVLTAAHRIGKMYLPIVAIINVGQRRSDPAFRHHGVRLAQKTLANHADRNAGRGRLDRRTQSSATGTDNQHVVLVCFVLGHGNR